MDIIDNIQQYEVYVDTKQDFYLPIFLKKTYEIHEYVDVAREDEIVKMERQEVNPFFVEFGFFEDIVRNRVNRGEDLTAAMLNFIRLRRPDVAALNNKDLRIWFDKIGVNEFPWNKGTLQEVTVDDIDEISFVAGHIVSKAKFFNIDVNK